MRKSYPYLNDSDFLYTADLQRLQNQFVKITLLDWNENPLEEIQGIATGGSISINGSSAVRRTCSLNMTVKDVSTGKITDTKNLISINKKIFLEIGITNRTGRYEKEYPIIWYPQGVYVITSCSVNTALGQGTTLSAQFKDKMCLLNGECGGIIPSAVRFDEYETIDETGKYVVLKPTIQQILRELVNHWGNEQLGRILISDIDEKAKMVMRWIGSYPVYMVNNSGNYFLTMSQSSIPAGAGYQTFEYGDDMGFIYTDFIWPKSWGELSCSAGDNVCGILEKIKSALGNYEYYYDVFGNFVWQEIKNYLNTTHATVEMDKLKNNDYFIDVAKGKSVYNISDNKLALSFANNPQYTRIKNDYVVWGIRETPTGLKLPIRYHLAIDKKPDIGNIYEVFFYVDPDDGLVKAKCPIKYESKSNFPKTGVSGLFYMDMSTNTIYTWNAETNEYVTIEGNNVVTKPHKEEFPIPGNKDTIYIDLSTNKQYIWSLDPESPHYKEVEAQIDARRAQYNADIAPLLAQIDTIEEINEVLVQRQIEEVEEILGPYETRLKVLRKQKEQEEQKIVVYNSELQSYLDRKSNLEIQISLLEEQIFLETDPVKKQELIEERDAAVAEHDKVLQLIDSVSADLAEAQGKVATYTTDIEAIENDPTYISNKDDLVILQQQLENLQRQVDAIQNEISDMTYVLNQDLNELSDAQYEYIEVASAFNLVKVQTTDWRSELYLEGAAAEPLGLESNYYYAELAAEWPKLYDLRKNHYKQEGEIIYTGGFYDEVLERPWDVDYMLDFIDTNTPIGNLSISNIGRRSKIENKDTYNCVFEPEIPDFVLIEAGQPDTEQKRRECEKRNQAYIQIDSNIYTNIASGGLKNSCFEEIKSLLWECTNYNSSVSIGVVPIYHLEPNTRITLLSPDTDIAGDFMISSISIPLTISGNMNISANQVQTKL